MKGRADSNFLEKATNDGLIYRCIGCQCQLDVDIDCYSKIWKASTVICLGDQLCGTIDMRSTMRRPSTELLLDVQSNVGSSLHWQFTCNWIHLVHLNSRKECNCSSGIRGPWKNMTLIYHPVGHFWVAQCIFLLRQSVGLITRRLFVLRGGGRGKYLAAALCSVQFIVSEWVMDLPLMG